MNEAVLKAKRARFFVTADGGQITDGARLYNYYDGYWVEVHFADTERVSPDSEFANYWDGWFYTRRVFDDGTVGGPNSGAVLNGERLAVCRPSFMRP